MLNFKLIIHQIIIHFIIHKYLKMELPLREKFDKVFNNILPYRNNYIL
ncbi:hypothetical protein EMIT079MI2_10520 [Bacillus sp. IT-79MI2]